MAFLKFFKKTEDEDGKVEVEKIEPKKGVSVDIEQKNKQENTKTDLPEDKDKGVKKAPNKTVKAQSKKKVSRKSEAHKWLRWPHVTEKATYLTGLNKYTFEVVKGANKLEIAKAIKGLYGVSVESVNIVNIPRKKRRVRRQIGYKPGYKKAIVTLREGDKIEILPH